MPLPRNQPIALDYFATHDWWAKVDRRGPDECWPWRQSVGSHGYGQTFDGHTVRLAHRVAWALHHQRQLPDDATIHHTCFTKVCCNPAHLVLATNVDNARMNGQHFKTHCPHGHPYEGSNLYVTPRGHRRCRACARARRS